MTATIYPPAAEPPSHTLTPETKLTDIIKTLPKEVFVKHPLKAWRSVAISIVAAALGYGAIAFAPWYLLPFAWFFSGTALTGFFVIAHDCAHRSFAKQTWLNDLVGHLAMLPLLYPFHGWRIQHDVHHLHTNKLNVDNAWHPWTEEGFKAESPAMQRLYKALRGGFWWLASIFHWALHHFNPATENVTARERGKFTFSAAFALVGGAMMLSALVYFTGWWGLVKFWLMPWLGYHFWMSTFTLVHHTYPGVQFKLAEEWNAAEAQLAGTVHCDYPKWVELLCHDINVHIPHHISTAIPSYNLRAAHASLKENWGESTIECKFNWELMKQVVGQCHIFHPQQAYQSFTEIKK
ncbi:fatty acid desaturase [Synechococcus sp. PCC 7336]|uniref:fatty acid desaturase n=1 Tax=Synechococcus sp. PCC 7336 TaxID=195250 RepID=UPI000347BF4A|nr:fatty acid desaturase [Synechococcus sp. PCC 7336]